METTNKKLRILNLYACLGGNRLLWDNCEVTAVELDPHLAEMYKKKFPDDIVIIEDAHEYLLNNYFKFDFIWSSPPCPSHSRARFFNSKTGPTKPIFPDLKLYEEILFLKHYFTGLFCVENVIPYYKPLIPAEKRGRHLYWCNFQLPMVLSDRKDCSGQRGANELQNLCEFHKIDLTNYKGEQRKVKIGRNLVDYEAGYTILNAARKIYIDRNVEQYKMFTNE